MKKNNKIKKMTREEIINELIKADINSIVSDGSNDYLYDILSKGFCGYNNYNDNKLSDDYYNRIDRNDIVIVIKKIKEIK